MKRLFFSLFLLLLAMGAGATNLSIPGKIQKTTFTVNKANIAKTVTNFPVLINLDSLPDTAFGYIHDTTSLWVQGNVAPFTRYPVRPYHVDTALNKGYLYANVPVSTAANSVYQILFGKQLNQTANATTFTNSGAKYYYSLQEATGNPACFLTGISLTATACTLNTTGAYFNSVAIGFNGTTSNLATVNNMFNYERTQAITIAFWITTTQAGLYRSILGRTYSGASISGCYLYMSNGKPYYVLCNAWGANKLSVYSDTVINDGTWKRVVVAYAGTSAASGVQFYINGALKNTATETSTLSASTAGNFGFKIGTLSNLNSFAGRLQDVRIDTVQWDSNDVKNDYNSFLYPPVIGQTISNAPRLLLQGNSIESGILTDTLIKNRALGEIPYNASVGGSGLKLINDSISNQLTSNLPTAVMISSGRNDLSFGAGYYRSYLDSIMTKIKTYDSTLPVIMSEPYPSRIDIDAEGSVSKTTSIAKLKQNSAILRRFVYENDSLGRDIKMVNCFFNFLSTVSTEIDQLDTGYTTDDVHIDKTAGLNLQALHGSYAAAPTEQIRYDFGGSGFPLPPGTTWKGWRLGTGVSVTGDADDGTLTFTASGDSAASPVIYGDLESSCLKATATMSAGTASVYWRADWYNFSPDTTGDSIAWALLSDSVITIKPFVQLRLLATSASAAVDSLAFTINRAFATAQMKKTFGNIPGAIRTGWKDTYIYESNPTTGYGSSPYLVAQTDTVGTEKRYILLNCEINTDIPDTPSIDSAKLNLYVYQAGTMEASSKLYAYRMIKDWAESRIYCESSANDSGQPTWTRAAKGGPAGSSYLNKTWTGSNFSIASDCDTNTVCTLSVPASTLHEKYTIDITKIVRQWQKSWDTACGLAIELKSNTAQKSVVLSSQQDTVGGNIYRPSVDIWYRSLNTEYTPRYYYTSGYAYPDIEAPLAMVKVDATTDDTVKIVWGFQVGKETLNSSGNPDTLWWYRVPLDTVLADSLGKIHVPPMSAAGVISRSLNKSVDTASVSGYSIQAASFKGEAGWPLIRYWIYDLSGEETTTPCTYVFEHYSRSWVPVGEEN